MNILADENIPFVADAFAGLGDVRTAPGREMNADMVRDASVLLVRSITKVNAELLDGSDIRFVATATIGEDHIDKPYLASRGIGFSSAPGSNANSVAEYVTVALLEIGRKYGCAVRDKTLGIVGVGNVGSQVLKKATALGMRCVLNDPPVARETRDERYRPIDEIFDCDIVTLHVPLTKEGPDATWHLADDTFFKKLKRGAVLLNTSRGPVADGEAVKRAIDDGNLTACVLDVWEGEPSVDPGLLLKTDIGTPHIAGYSFDGKINGVRQIYEAACRFFDKKPVWDPTPLLPEPDCPEVAVAGDVEDIESAVLDTVRTVYDIREDDTAMRDVLGMPVQDRPAAFDMLRKQYRRRREFFNTRAIVMAPNPGIETVLSGIGFR